MQLVIALLLCGFAAAQDDEFELDWDDIDLDGSKPELIDYNGGFTQTAPDFHDDARITVTLPSGNLKVRCTDTDGVRGSLSFTLRGSDKDAMQRMGEGIRLSVWGKEASGGAKVVVPSQPSAVKEAKIELSVSVPSGATVTADAPRGWVDVLGCGGYVTANGRDGAHAKGPMKGFKLTSSGGDVKASLEGSKLESQSAATSNSGKATVVMPLDYGVRLDARGKEVQMAAHEADGNVSDTSISGAIGGGGAGLTVRAGAAVVIETP